ncbi:hypothetical protein DV735_g3363, partial [Chaetothyriales sp. CBS 134920]
MGSNSDDDSDQDNGLDLFQEPADFYPPEKEPSFVQYTLQDGPTLSLRLIGHSPLWGHLLWNAAQVVTAFIEERAAELVQAKTVLELGAGAGLPSLACAIHGAKQVVVTDYPDPDLVANLRYNIDHCGLIQNKAKIVAEGYLWGNSIESLRQHLDPGQDGFDLLILADVLFNHSEHEKLAKTLDCAMKPGTSSTALVFFTPYRPWLLDKDLRFFQLVQEHGFRVTKLLEHVMDKVMFDNDPGDELLRRTVFAYEVKRQASRVFTKPDLPIRKVKNAVMAKLQGIVSKDGSQVSIQPDQSASHMKKNYMLCIEIKNPELPIRLEISNIVTVSLTSLLGLTPGQSHASVALPPGLASAQESEGSQWTIPDVGVFSHMAVYTFSGNSLPEGLVASDYVVKDTSNGAPFDHQFTPDNVRVANGYLNLFVPGGQSPSRDEALKCAEVVTTMSNILHASVRTDAIFSDVAGTCHGKDCWNFALVLSNTCPGNFFYREDTQEIDTEYITDPSSISRANSGSPDPLWYVNQAVNPGHKSSTYGIVTAPASDITTQVHEYRIDWTESYTAFYFDGQLQSRLTDNIPSQPGNWIWNNWSNGDKGWSCGPPATDNVFKIQKITMYYNTSNSGQ